MSLLPTAQRILRGIRTIMRCAVPTIVEGAVAHWLYQNVPSITRVAVLW